MNHPPNTSAGGQRDDVQILVGMEEEDRTHHQAMNNNGCASPASGPLPIRTSPTLLTVEELAVKNMHDSRLHQHRHFYTVSSESELMRTGLVFQDSRPQTILGLGQNRPPVMPPPPHIDDIQKPLWPLVETNSSTQQRPAEVSEPEFSHGGVSLRGWIKSRRSFSGRICKTEGLKLFRQIVELAHFAHSQDIVLQELRPSHCILLPSNKVKYVGSSVRSRATRSDSKRKRLRVEGRDNSRACPVAGTEQHQKPFQELEEQWYTTPEGCCPVDCGIPSNIYSLGVLLFELLCSFESQEAHQVAMSDLQYRVLPPAFLSENPKEAGFCLWLLHPEQSSRPTTGEILQSDLFHGPFECHPAECATMSSDENDAESELLLHYLAFLKEEKIRHVSKLTEDIRLIEEDLKEIQRSSYPLRFTRPSSSLTEETRWMRSIRQLEESYFLMRSQPRVREAYAAASPDRYLLRHRERRSDENSSNQLGPFFEALCKFARYSKFEVRGSLKCGDLLNGANVIRSIGFDRDEEYVATAGVSKKIKVFEFSELLDDSIDIHYPTVEMSNNSKLSCICWNGYMKNFLASTDYDGLVQIWDAVTARCLLQYNEHQKRAWCVDFCQVDPTRFASGSDDCSVKLWRINERNSIGTIWNPANVCCVQFSPHSSNLLAFGCANNNIYCYDLRSTQVPWCTLSGHGKTVSYVKFWDSETLVSASTDNTLKKWDLRRGSSDGLSSSSCTSTFKGHTNEKNFVGLSVFDGYVACGSETNEVYSYHESLPVPITSHKFGPLDPASGIEIGSDDGHFVSSVCWGRRSNMIVAANSTGSLKVLQMV